MTGTSTNPDSIMVLIFICIFFGTGMLCALWSICRIYFGFSKELKKFELAEKLAEAKQEETRKTYLRQWLNTHGTKKSNTADPENEGKDKEPPPPDSHKHSPLYMRVYSLYRALVDDNGARQLPQLHDLRELAMQDEMSRFSVATLRTIISFLLIVGIFGTLYGVHSVIGKWGYNLSAIEVKDLTPALEPSMLAVISTVLLMWLRGGYFYLLQSYLLKLDQMTMEKLLPRLQPESQTQGSHRTIDDNIERFADNIKKIAEQLSSLKNTLSKLKDKVAPYRAASESLKQVIEQAKENASELKRYQLAQNNALKQTEDVIAAAENERLASLKTNADTIHRYKEAADRTRNSFAQLTDASSRSLAKLRENMQLMSHLAETGRRLPTYAEDIRKYVADLDKTVKLQGNIDTALNSITKHREDMKQMAEKAFKTAQETAQNITVVSGHIEAISGIESLYQNDLQTYEQKLTTTHEKLKVEAEHLKKANERLFDALTKRKNTITTKSQS